MSLMVMRGQKTDLTKRFPGLSEAIVGIGWDTGKSDIEIDAAAFMLQGNGKCRDDEDFIFYGNPTGRNDSVTIENAQAPDKASFKIKLGAVPADVEKIAFTLTIYDGPPRGHSFGQVPSAYLRVTNTGGEELIRFNMGRDFHSETAIVVAELYRHKGEWKFNSIAMGYQGGLAALCGSFGINVSDSTPSPTPTPTPTPAPTPKTTSAPKSAPKQRDQEQPGSKINLSKIELKKKGEKINLAKKANNKLGEILINLNWNQQKKQSGGVLGSIFGGGGGGVDLDLGCLIEIRDGGKTAIQALGKSFGSYHTYPFIALDGDDRTGSVTGGENIRINGDHIPEFKRILVYAYIYEGVANWAQADGVVTIKQPGGPDIIVQMDEHNNRKIMCAIALIQNINNETFSIERVVEYFSGHRDMDKAFGWGMNWKAGRK